MRPLLMAALLLAAPAGAFDGETPLTFKGAAQSVRLKVPADAKPGQVLWESGASDLAETDFAALLFQGVAMDSRLSFEASLGTGGEWGEWRPAAVERFPNGRYWAKVPLAGRKGDILRFRLVHKGAAKGKAVELYSFELAAALPEEDGRGRPPVPFETVPSTDPTKPAVISREEWGAADPTAAYEPMLPMRLTVHHTEAAQPLTPEDAVQEMKVIQRFHQKGRGWIDIGYHFLIDGAGRVYQGRPETVVGAHVRNKNEGNVGISLMGSFHPPKDMQPTQAQWDSLVAVARWVTTAYAIDPATIRGHRDHQATSCPGDGFYPRLEELRRLLGVPPAAVRLKSPPARTYRFPDFSAKLRPEGLRELFDGGRDR